MFKFVGTDSFDFEVLQGNMPTLLARIRPDHGFKEQTMVLEDISNKHVDELRVCLLDENSIETFKRYAIDGSPTFVIFHRGEEKRRMLGKADENTLNQFVIETLTSFSGE
jgi:hypothetical protein